MCDEQTIKDWEKQQAEQAWSRLLVVLEDALD